jgi:flagellar hook protein FlgE
MTMLGAIFTSLSGMDAYTAGLQTISNNVSNLNSSGYKQTIQTFGNMVDDSGTAFLGDSANRDTGAGVQISSITTDFTQGTLTATNNDLDLGIQGNGFLVVMSPDGKTFYSRTGSFAVDKDGYISDQATGDRLAVLDASGHPVPINLNSKQTSPAVATQTITFSNNLSSDASTDTVSNITVTDDKGNQEVLSAVFNKNTDAGLTDNWTVQFQDAGGNDVGQPVTVNFIGDTPDDTSQVQSINFTPSNGGDPMTVKVDFTNLKSDSGGSSSTASATADGNLAGTLSSVTVDDTGQILLTYTNQKTEQEGAVAIANFQNPQVLTKLSNGLYKNDSGVTPGLFASNTGGVGTLTPKTIEASNVDLSAEFGDLILLQRGFQACSEVISVSNDMIQQLFAIRGQ